MKRRLVYEGYARPHPIRHHVRRAAARNRRMRDDSDLKLFGLSFAAFFTCFYTFIL